MTEPKGNPGCLRECVAKLPIRPRCVKVRARSASDGSGTGARCGAGGPACRPKVAIDRIFPLSYYYY